MKLMLIINNAFSGQPGSECQSLISIFSDGPFIQESQLVSVTQDGRGSARGLQMKRVSIVSCNPPTTGQPHGLKLVYNGMMTQSPTEEQFD